jgi:GDP-L-fucose synthase
MEILRDRRVGVHGGVMITGAGGVIGRALTAELTKYSEAPVIAVSSQDIDLRNWAATEALFQQYRPKIVYHLAARVSGIMGNLRAQGAAYFDNTLINTNTIEAARLSGVAKIIAMGSSAIYSDQITLPMREEDIWNGPPHNSEFGYAHAKRSMLAHLQSYQNQYGLDYAYCVSTNLFGPHDRFDEQNGHVLPSLISKFHRAAHQTRTVTVWGTGTPQRDFFYSKDAARAIRLIGEKFSGSINLASGNPVSIRDVAELLVQIADPTIHIEWDRTKPDGQALRDYDVSKLKHLGFQAQYTLTEALRETYRWYCENVSQARR